MIFFLNIIFFSLFFIFESSLSLSLSNQILDKRRGRRRGNGESSDMASPSKRREMDMMKLWVSFFQLIEFILGFFFYLLMSFFFFLMIWSVNLDYRMMSDYKVETINDDLQMFYVTFHGPTDSNSPLLFFSLWFFPFCL